jgi:hypothetical protein
LFLKAENVLLAVEIILLKDGQMGYYFVEKE